MIPGKTLPLEKYAPRNWGAKSALRNWRAKYTRRQFSNFGKLLFE